MTRRTSLAVIVVLGALSTCGCAFPAAGPESWEVRAGQADPAGLPYALVPVTPQVEGVLATAGPRIAGEFVDRRGPADIRFGIGDVVSVTIYESGAGGLFIPIEAGTRPGNFVVLPNQSVDNSGNISIPYAGAIRAKDRTAVEIQQAIVAALKSRALEPQAVVALVDQRASSVSVLGDVATSGRFPASASGERILDLIARGGGPRSQGFDEWVTLERNGHRATVPFGVLIQEPANNIYVRPQDTIYLYREPQTFVGFGASGAQGQFAFDAWRISAAEAVAKMSGLNDIQADPAAVFVYRGETREVAARLGVDVTKYTSELIPVVYNLNLRNPAGYFLATKFQMRNKDVVYTSNSLSVEAGKLLQFVVLAGAAANAPLNVGVNLATIRALNRGGTTAATAVITTTVP